MADATFPKACRLRKSAEFRQVQRGPKVVTRNLVVRYRQRPGAARFGLAVSRKVGNAVVRNRVKRWLRESLRHRRAGVSDVELVVIARPGAGDAGLAVLDAELGQVFRRLGASG